MSDAAWFLRWQIGVVAALVAALVLVRVFGLSDWFLAPLILGCFPVTLLASLHIP